MLTRFSTIEFTIQDRVAQLVLNRPPVNVLNIEMMEEICAGLTSLLNQSDVNALVIRAKGKVFSAGVAIEDHLGEKTEPMIHLFHKMFHLLVQIPCPSIAVVEGAALGGGCEIATFCDMTIATKNAKFGQPEINLGLFPPVSIVSFPLLTSLNRAKELLLTGETISAEKAYEWGLINRVVDPDAVESELERLLENLRNKSAAALKLTRVAIHRGLASTFAASIGEVEQLYLQQLMNTNDAQEGLQSFLDKRQPKWVHS
ncbi:enoyl-CoA hydratase/isomerase family protein [Bacillus sp. P2(2020)]|uniref:Enoyl-CoA hydratase/isomerase family protein n=1 Tax=Calidifontibacillus erzurumensis TaxID=2741433 RepID=A0A8J8GDZ8_9BACI|nr:enoyl-CoA hydratase/isomerase family protein [Calidifontibacillus erzurumensis]